MENNIDIKERKINRPKPRPWPTLNYVIFAIYMIVLSYLQYNDVSFTIRYFLIIAIIILAIIDEFLLRLYKSPKYRYFINPFIPIFIIYLISKPIWQS